MSKLDKFVTVAKFAAATSIAALSTTGCAEDCDVVANNPDAPVLEDAAAVEDYCDGNKATGGKVRIVTCLEVEDNGDKVSCDYPVYQCSKDIRKKVGDQFVKCVGGEGSAAF